MSTKRLYFAPYLLTVFFSLSLTLNLVNFFWIDILFGLVAITAISLTKKSWPDFIEVFGLNNKLIQILFGTYFLAGIIGYFLHSPMQANEWIKIGNLRWILGFFACYSAGYLLKSQKRQSKSIFIPLLFILLVVSVKHFQETSGKFFSHNLRNQGFYSNPNYFAMALAVLWATILPFAIYAKTTLNRYTSFLIILLAAVILITTYTRTSWIAMLSSIVVALFYTRSKKTALFSALLVCVFTTAVLLNWFSLKERIAYSFDFSGPSSQGARLAIWNATWHIFLDHPFFGVGFEHASKLYREYYVNLGQPTKYIPGHAHNQFLEVLNGAGIIGLAGYLGAFGSGFVFFHRQFKSATETHQKQLALGSILCIVALFACSWTETPFIQHEVRNYVMIILGFSYGYLSKHHPESDSSRIIN